MPVSIYLTEDGARFVAELVGQSRREALDYGESATAERCEGVLRSIDFALAPLSTAAIAAGSVEDARALLGVEPDPMDDPDDFLPGPGGEYGGGSM